MAPHPVSVPAGTTDSEPSLRAREYRVEDLTALGIDVTFAAGALDLTGEDTLLDYAGSAPAPCWISTPASPSTRFGRNTS